MESATIPLPIDTTPGDGERRPYHRPQLVVHGNVQRLTRKIGTDLDADGGSFVPRLPITEPTPTGEAP